MLRFWTPEKLDIMTKVILHKSNITLSRLDWLCTNYSKSQDVHYSLSPDDPRDFYIYEEYTKYLSDFSRPCFDSYSRNQRILVEYVCTNDELVNPTDPTSKKIEWDNKNQVGTRMIGSKKMV